MSDPEWLPAPLLLEEHDGDWNRYVEAAYAVFYKDFIQSQPTFDGCWVRCRRDPLSQGKEAGFWHCTSSGRDEANRQPEIRRIERIRWVRAVIENAGAPEVQVWVRLEGNEPRWHLWVHEEFLVVLGERVRKHDNARYFQLITAFDTPHEHQKRKQRKQFEKWRSKNG